MTNPLRKANEKSRTGRLPSVGTAVIASLADFVKKYDDVLTSSFGTSASPDDLSYQQIEPIIELIKKTLKNENKLATGKTSPQENGEETIPEKKTLDSVLLEENGSKPHNSEKARPKRQYGHCTGRKVGQNCKIELKMQDYQKTRKMLDCQKTRKMLEDWERLYELNQNKLNNIFAKYKIRV